MAAVERPAARRVGLSRRRWGYVVWAVALGFVFVPEILAAIPFTESQLPFPTISRMTGHLEYEHAEWEIAPTMLSVFVLLSLLRVPPKQKSGGHTAETDVSRGDSEQTGPYRTPAGRLTSTPVAKTAEEFDNERLGITFAVRSIAVAIVITLITLWAARHWPNQYIPTSTGRKKLPNYHVAYFLYGSIGFFWLLLPSLSAWLGAKDSVPSLFRTIVNVEEWIAKPRKPVWPERVSNAAAWLVSFLLVWGMVFLMLHLTLYPFPNITRILNHGG
ncbi:MAG: hypothetical protein WAQ33_06950 [Gaiellaceae bacterium]